MNLNDRAELVRQCRFEMKQRRQGVRARPLYDAPNFRGESANQYINRTAEGGDSSFAQAAQRWDNQRNKLRGRARRGVRPAPHWNGDDYAYGYNNRPADSPDNYSGVIRPPRRRWR